MSNATENTPTLAEQLYELAREAKKAADPVYDEIRDSEAEGMDIMNDELFVPMAKTLDRLAHRLRRMSEDLEWQAKQKDGGDANPDRPAAKAGEAARRSSWIPNPPDAIDLGHLGYLLYDAQRITSECLPEQLKELHALGSALQPLVREASRDREEISQLVDRFLDAVVFKLAQFHDFALRRAAERLAEAMRMTGGHKPHEFELIDDEADTWQENHGGMAPGPFYVPQAADDEAEDAGKEDAE